MAAAWGPPAPPGGVQLFSSRCPPRSRRTHNPLLPHKSAPWLSYRAAELLPHVFGSQVKRIAARPLILNPVGSPLLATLYSSSRAAAHIPTFLSKRTSSPRSPARNT